MLLKIRPRAGEVPRLDPTQLPEGAAQYALNCDLSAGDLRGIRDASLALTVLASPVMAMHVAPAGNWYTWTRDVDVIRSPIVDDQYSRMYWSDGTGIYVSRGDVGGNGAAPDASNTWLAGVPNPTVAPQLVGNMDVYPDTVTGYSFSAYCTRDANPTLLASTQSTVEAGKKYRLVVTDTSCEGATTSPGGTGNGSFVVGSATIFGEEYGKSYQVYSNTAAPTQSSPLFVTLDLDPLPNEIFLYATRTAGTFSSQVKRFVRVGNTAQYTTVSGTSVPIEEETAAGVLSFELTITRDDGTTTPVTVAKSGTTALPADIGMGQWSVSVTAVDATTYDFTVSAGGYVDSRAYVYTYVNIWGEESAPSPPLLVEAVPGIGVNINAMYSPTTGYQTVNRIRLYRTNSGSQATDYQLALEVYVNVAMGNWQLIADNIAAAALGEVMSTLGWAPPPAGVSGLSVMANGIAVAFKGNELWFSEPYLPAVMKPGNAMSFPNSVVGIQPFEQALFVTTRANPWLVQGVTPDTMSQMPLPEVQAGLTKNSITQLGNQVAYLTNDGIVLARGLDTTVGQSLQLFTRASWRDRYAAHLPYARLSAHDGMLLCTFDNGAEGFILRMDEQAGVFTRYDQSALATMVWPENDWLYVSRGGFVYAFAGQTNTLAAVWWSPDYLLPKPHNFGACQVTGTGSVTLRFYADGVLKHTKTLTLTGAPVTFRLPGGFVAAKWSVKIELTANAVVKRINLATTPMELQGAD